MSRTRHRRPAVWLAVVLAGCGQGGIFTQPQAVVDLRFSQTARNPAAVEAMSRRITLVVSGEGLQEPVQRVLEPESQLVSLALPVGTKDFVARAWGSDRLIAEGQAGLEIRPQGQPQEVVINLIPVLDPPGGPPGIDVNLLF